MLFLEKELDLNEPEKYNMTTIGNCTYLATSKHVPSQYREQFRNMMKTFRHKMASEENKHIEYNIEVDYFAWDEWLHPIHVCLGIPWFIATRFDLICILIILIIFILTVFYFIKIFLLNLAF